VLEAASKPAQYIEFDRPHTVPAELMILARAEPV
jgi:hypothetical protein